VGQTGNQGLGGGLQGAVNWKGLESRKI
jgi:hypothetical protein